MWFVDWIFRHLDHGRCKAVDIILVGEREEGGGLVWFGLVWFE